MKILHRYILFSFLRNYLLSLLVLLGLYIVLHMVFQFDEIVELGSANQGRGQNVWELVASLADYYFHQSFLFFVQLSGVIPVVAAAFTLVRMSRFNELTAILVAGVPLLKLLQPVIIAGVILNLLLLPLVQELIIPRMIHKLTPKIDDLKMGSVRAFEIKMMQDAEGNLLRASRYTPAGPGQRPRMEVVDILERDSQGAVSRHIAADAAEWIPEDQIWRLDGGVEVAGLQPDQQRAEPRPIYHYETSINPEEIELYRSGSYVELLSTRRIDQLLQRPKIYGTVDLLRVKHSRWATFLINIVLLLLALACLTTREPGALRRQVVWCFVLVGLCMATVFVTQNLAGNPPPGMRNAPNWPLIMAWLPILIFGPLAVFLLDRMKT
ncbi:MAG: LptF/LptG family permease [Phycisphaerae bacterium]|nr:LptF/LptG family permease [Phycisphaerae bacterium]MDW8262348.1 LptF/LptG family permease [Phycisphaerales bacterium]